MVHLRVPKHDPEAGGAVAPAYTQRLDLEPIPKLRMPGARHAAGDGVPA